MFIPPTRYDDDDDEDVEMKSTLDPETAKTASCARCMFYEHRWTEGTGKLSRWMFGAPQKNGTCRLSPNARDILGADKEWCGQFKAAR